MSDGWNIALLGATGAVGNAVLELLAERQFLVGEFYLLASENSAGEIKRFEGRSVRVENAAEFDWSQAQLAFFVAGRDASARFADDAANAGCLVIDSSELFALSPDVPLVDAAGLGRLKVTNLISVYSYGKVAVDALAGESARLLNGIPADDHHFGRQLAFNMMPQQVDGEGSVESERRLVDQVRKVLQDEGLPIAVSSVQAPVFYGNVQIVHIENLCPLSTEEARAELALASDISLSKEDSVPTPVTDASGNGEMNIGGVRNDYGIPELLQFWSVADNIRFGGALMAVKTVEKLVQEYL